MFCCKTPRLCCLLVLSIAATVAAQPVVVVVDCATAGSGCTNPIPATGTAGPMDPSSIFVAPQVFDCAAGGLADVNVNVEFFHPFRGDLEAFLLHVPTGIMVELFTDVGGGQDHGNVTLDDEAATPITDPAVCGILCVGPMRPEGILANFNGIDPAGEWRLEINDDKFNDVGSLLSWSLELGLDFADADDDGDGITNCADGCPDDPNKTSPGACGCGTPDEGDTDNDGVDDCFDDCPDDPTKLMPGACGCGTPDDDTDGDGVADCEDECPNDANKVDTGPCGCGTPDVDSDGDGLLDCVDNCPNDANSDQADDDGDGVGDACTPPPAGQPNPCAPPAMMMAPMMLSVFVMRRFRKARRRR